jgi:hypothetical protein
VCASAVVILVITVGVAAVCRRAFERYHSSSIESWWL